MLNNLNLLFLIMTIFGSIISFSSTNWFSAWLGLEINMISFVPYIMNNKNILSTESSMNYFLMQASASSMFLFFCINNSLNNFSHLFFTESFSTFLILIPLMIKLGSAPFHTWFIVVMQGLNWNSCLLLMTLQKIAPLFILNFLVESKTLFFFSLLSVLVGSIGGLNQTSLKKILAFSSINHLGWMMTSINLNKSLLINYFLFYSFMNMFVVSFLNKSSISQFNQTFSNLNISYWSISILSLGGLPPFLGFLPKWMILQALILNKHFLLTMIFVMTALITLLYYTRLIYSSLMLSSQKQKWVKKSFQTPAHKTFMVVASSLGLIIYNLVLT